MNEYANEVGGIYHIGDFEVIPYNHWKKDMEWMVLVLEREEYQYGSFIPVRAHSVREAVQLALKLYTNWSNHYE